MATSTRKIEVELLGDSRSLERSFDRSARSANHFSRDVGKATRGAAAGSGIFRGLGRSLAFASGGFLAFASVTDLLRKSVDAAVEQAQTQKQLAAQFRASGLELKTYNKQIEETTSRLSLLSGFQDDELKRSFTTAFRGTKDVTASLKLEAVAADVARGTHKELSVVTLALTKGYLGQATALRRLGILLPASAKGMQLLNLAQARFAGQARAGTSAQQRLTAVFHNTEEIIGGALLPTINRLTTQFTLWLHRMNETGELQRRVNRIVDDAGVVVRSLADAFRVLRAVLRPVVNQLGGLSNTIKLLGVAFIGLRLAKLATEIRAIGVAWGFVTTQAEAAAAAQAAASAGGIGGVAGFRGRGIFGKILPGGLLAGAAAGAALAIAQRGESSVHVGGPLDVSVGPGDLVSYRDPVTGKFVLARGFHGHSAAQLEAFLRKDIEKRHPELVPPQVTGEDVAQRNAQARGGRIPGAGTGRGGSGRLGLKARFAKLELQRAQATLTATESDDKKILQLEAKNLKAQLARRKLTLAERTALTNQLGQIEDEIAGIEERAAQKRLDKQKKAADKAKAERKKAHDAAVKAAREAAADAKARILSLRDLINTERDRIGTLFTGPVFDPSDAQRKAALGAPTPGSNVKTLISDLKAQIQQFKAFERDLKTLAKRGAPPQLLAELRQGGLAVAPQVHALATAGGGDFQKFKQLFIQRERLAVQAAKQERPVVNLTVIVEKDSGKVTVKTTPTAQKRGRHPGINFNQSSLSFGPH